MAAEPSSILRPTTIERLAAAVYPAFAMLAGMQLDVFTPLKDGPMTAEQLAHALGVSPRKLRPLLYALVAAELVKVDEQRFSNTPEADHFLVRGRPTYLGGRQENFADTWPAALKTAVSIRTGSPQAKHDFSAMSAEALAAFFRGLHPTTLATGHDLATRYDFSGHRALLDVAGGSGGMAIALTEAYPHLRATVVDLPTVTPITERFVREAGASDRVRVMTADVVQDSLSGAFDVAVVKSFIQVLSPEQARRALRHISDVMNSGGAIYILGQILDNSRLSPLESVTRNLLFLNVYEEGQAFTEGEYLEWLSEAGFSGCERARLREGNSVITARKPP